MKRKRDGFDEIPVESSQASQDYLALNKEGLIEALNHIDAQSDFGLFKTEVMHLLEDIEPPNGQKSGLLSTRAGHDSVALRRDILVSELYQILEARTAERARYYLRRLEKGVKKVKTGKINDINLTRWKEYDDIITDSLWVLGKRDTTGAHLGWYWGNFIPQIPRQLMLRYTRKGDWVLDLFAGSGTTLIECKRQGRNGIGIELSEKVAERARELIAEEVTPHSVKAEVVVGDSARVDLKEILKNDGIERVQLIIMHPPYHDIIKFSEDKSDLSNEATSEGFLQRLGQIVDNATPFLERGRYFGLVIGDKYCNSEWVPLGFYCMNEVLKRAYSLKSIIVKNFDETRAKREQKELWRYRALVGGFYIFKHEYIFLFEKK
jgi:hypothetical protein